MKKTLLLLLLSLMAIPAMACGPESPDYDANVFSLCPNPYYYSRVNDLRLAEAWSQLVRTRVNVAQSRQLAEVSLEELDTLNNPIAIFARKSSEVKNYLYLLVHYLNATHIVSNPWSYPSAEERAEYDSQLATLLQQASSYKGHLMQERYQLLRMRILFRQGEYTAIQTEWEQHPLTSGSVFADMARDLYAGALYQLGRVEDAAVQYALNGNMFDAHHCMRYMHGTACMNRIIASDPNSPVLPYMLEEIVNGCAESIRYYEAVAQMLPFVQSGECVPFQRLSEIRVPYDCYEWEGCDDGARISRTPSMHEWFQPIRTLQVGENEAIVLQYIIDRQLADKQVQDRCMWLSAQAYLQYMQKSYAAAWSTIEKAVKAPGSDYSKQNAQLLRLLIVTHHSDIKVMERTLAQGLPLLPNPYDDPFNDLSADSSYHYWNYGPMPVTNQDRFAHLVSRGIVARYLREGDSVMASLSWSLLNPDTATLYSYLPSVGGEHYQSFCALSHDKQHQLLNMIQQTLQKRKKQKNPFANYLISRQPFSPWDYLDVIGTNLIRDGRFADAIPYLEQVPINFLRSQNIAPYAVTRSFRDIPWERKPVEEYTQFDENIYFGLTTNAKLDYCRAVLQSQQQLLQSQGDARCQAAYDLASLYFQASIMGSCWWLAYYGVSNDYVYSTYLTVGHFDFVEQSRLLLGQALSSTSIQLRYQAYYLTLLEGQDDLLKQVWDPNTYEYSTYLDTQSKYFPTLQRYKSDLYGRADAPDYISHCDLIRDMCRKI